MPCYEEIKEITKNDIAYILELKKGNPYHDRLGRFTSAGGGTAVSSFTPAKTIEEAREYAKTALGFSRVDYSYSYIDQKEMRQVSGSLDIDTVNHINKTITDIQERYPEMKGAVKDLACTDRNVYAQVGFSGRDGSASLEIGAKVYKDGVKSVYDKYAEDVDLGYHPKGTDGGAVLWHEYGHVYAGMANEKQCGQYATPSNKVNAIRMGVAESGWKNEAVKTIVSEKNYQQECEMLGLDSSPMALAQQYGGKVSRYATKNNGELFAEAFAAHNTGNGNQYTKALIDAAGADRGN